MPSSGGSRVDGVAAVRAGRREAGVGRVRLAQRALPSIVSHALSARLSRSAAARCASVSSRDETLAGAQERGHLVGDGGA